MDFIYKLFPYKSLYTTDAGKVTKALVAKRQKEIKGDKEYAEEYALLKEYMSNYDKQTALKAELKKAEADLDKIVLAKFAELTESDDQLHDECWGFQLFLSN